MVSCSKSCFWTSYVWCCRFFGLIIALALWGLGAESVAYFSIIDGILILLSALIVTLLESVFTVQIMLSIAHNTHTHCLSASWRAVLWVDVWRKGVLYCVVSIPSFLAAHQYMTLWAYLTGSGLCLLGLLYVVLTFRNSNEKVVATRALDNRTYDRFDDVADIDELEDSIVNPDMCAGVMTLAGQSEVLEI